MYRLCPFFEWDFFILNIMLLKCVVVCTNLHLRRDFMNKPNY